jgi:hypothetical protein
MKNHLSVILSPALAGGHKALPYIRYYMGAAHSYVGAGSPRPCSGTTFSCAAGASPDDS